MYDRQPCCLRPTKLVWSFSSRHLTCLMKGMDTYNHRILFDLCIRAAKCRLLSFLQYLVPMSDLTEMETCYLIRLSRKSLECVIYLNSTLIGLYPHLTFSCVDALKTCVYLSELHGWDDRVAEWLVKRMRFDTLALLIDSFSYPVIDRTVCRQVMLMCCDKRHVASILPMCDIPLFVCSTECTSEVCEFLKINDTDEPVAARYCSIDRLASSLVNDPKQFFIDVLMRPDFNMRMIRHSITKSFSFFIYFMDQFSDTQLSYIAHHQRHYNAMLYFGKRFGYDNNIDVNTCKSKFRKKILNY